MTLAEAHRQYQIALENRRAARETAANLVTLEDDARHAEDDFLDAEQAAIDAWSAR